MVTRTCSFQSALQHECRIVFLVHVQRVPTSLPHLPDVATRLLPWTTTGGQKAARTAFERALAASVRCARARRGTRARRVRTQWMASVTSATS
eukprot:122661-Prymnesium_polylepis.1